MADARRQLRSGTVLLGGVGLLAAALTACSSDADKRCVDRGSYQLGKGYKVVSDKYCASGNIADAWYYGGSKKAGWVRDGSFSRPRSHYHGGHYGSHYGGHGIRRGGFGGHFGSHGG